MNFEDKTAIVETAVLDVRQPQERGPRSACFVVIAGSEVGRMYKIGQDGAELIVGRAMDAGIRIVDDGVSRRHAVVAPSVSGGITVSDLGSTNGTYVNGARVSERRLEDGDRIQIGTTTILKFTFQDAVEEDFVRRQYESATRDVLTGCFNKKYFLDHMPTEFAFARRHRRPLSLAFADIDHFKQFNDTYGHTCGDAVLKEVAEVMRETVRTEDTVCRWGGEEFALIMRDTGPEQAFIAAERIRRAIEAREFAYEDLRLKVTVSVGVATGSDEPDLTLEGLQKQADDLLYRAKSNGRNRTETPVL